MILPQIIESDSTNIVIMNVGVIVTKIKATDYKTRQILYSNLSYKYAKRTDIK